MDLTRTLNLFPQRFDQAVRKHCDPVFPALSVPNQDMAIPEVDILDTQPQAFHQPHASSVQEAGHQPIRSLKAGKQLINLFPGEDNGQTFRALRPYQPVEPRQVHSENVFVKEQQGRKRLILGRGRNVPVTPQVIQKCGYFRLAQFGGVPLAVEIDKPFSPITVGFFRSAAVVKDSYGVTQPIQETRANCLILRSR
jgi:hypothetical protein